MNQTTASFTRPAAEKIVNATKMVLGQNTDLSGSPVKTHSNYTREFWASIDDLDDSVSPIQYAWTETGEPGFTVNSPRSGTTAVNFATEIVIVYRPRALFLIRGAKIPAAWMLRRWT
jgi:hypothetical protein